MKKNCDTYNYFIQIDRDPDGPDELLVDDEIAFYTSYQKFLTLKLDLIDITPNELFKLGKRLCAIACDQTEEEPQPFKMGNFTVI